jgi:hypothetical protein
MDADQVSARKSKDYGQLDSGQQGAAMDWKGE